MLHASPGGSGWIECEECGDPANSDQLVDEPRVFFWLVVDGAWGYRCFPFSWGATRSYRGFPNHLLVYTYIQAYTIPKMFSGHSRLYV